MSKSRVTVTCDGCGNDLTSTSNGYDYRLLLANETIHPPAGFSFDMIAHPAIKENVHFCEIECLRAWLDKTFPVGGRYHGGKLWAKSQRESRAKGEEPDYL